MKQNNFTITVFSNTAETAKARFKADIKIFNYGNDVDLSDTNIYKADSIDDLQSELRHHQDKFGKEYNLVRNFKAEMKAKIAQDQSESFSFAFRDGDESYVVMVLEDADGSLVGHMRHVSRRDEKGRFMAVSVEKMQKRRSQLATSVSGEWKDGENGLEFNVSFFVGNKATIKLTKDKKIAESKAAAKESTVSAPANSDLMKMLADMQARIEKLEQENKEIKAELAALKTQEVKEIVVDDVIAANDEVITAAPSLTCVNGIRADLIKTLAECYNLDTINAHLEKKITGEALTMDDMAVIMRGDMAEIGSKYAVKGTRAERDREWGELLENVQ